MDMRTVQTTRGFIGRRWPLLLAIGVVLFLVWREGESLREQAPDNKSEAINTAGRDLSALDDENEILTAQRLDEGQRTESTAEAENIRVYQLRNEGVVNITTQVVAYSWFLEPIPQRGTTGSGSIIDDDGYVLTNYHVIANATEIAITLADGDRYNGEVVGSDPENDIAILKFNPDGKRLAVVPFGDSSDLQVGVRVLAIGNPYGLDRTLTTGIISGLNRPVRVSSNLIVNDMIQTDASINPGNSGGPLLDTGGNMIGMNTAIFSPSGGSVGIGFAVPIRTVHRVVNDIIRYGRVERGWIDIVPRQLFPQLVNYARLPINRGILISEVTPGGNADRAGLRGGKKEDGVRYGRTIIYLGGDVITKIGDRDIMDITSLFSALEQTKPGDDIAVTFIRNGNTRQTTVTLSTRPAGLQIE